MINGEGPASPDPFDSFTPKTTDDVSPGSLSRYSSCGGESEFERYCSANSVMGTPSFCSSFGPANDRIESEFGSLKSLENFSLGGRLKFDRNSEEHKLSDSLILEDVMTNSGDGEFGLRDGERNFGEPSGIDTRQESFNPVGDGDNGGLCGLGLDFDGSELEEDGSSSRHEHFEDVDDDSMYGCGSDDENRKNIYTHRNIGYNKEEAFENEAQNPLLINSSVAFGSDDWDDFEQEQETMLGGTLVSLTSDQFQEHKEPDFETERGLFKSKSTSSAGLLVVNNVSRDPGGIRQVEGDELSFRNSELKQVEEVRDMPVAICQVQGTHEVARDGRIISTRLSRLEQEDVRDISVACNIVQGAIDTADCWKSCSNSDLCGMELDPFEEKNPMGLEWNILDYSLEREFLCVKSEETIGVDDRKILENQETGDVEVELDPLNEAAKQICSSPTDFFENISAEFVEDSKLDSTQLSHESNRSRSLKITPTSVDLLEEHPAPIKAEKVEVHEFYDEIVNEMEEILLDSSESPGARFPQGNHMSQPQLSLPLRDGGSTASTSGTDDAFSLISRPLRIDRIEVVGAKQKKGDISLSERLVGVKEYTVYRIRVWSGKDHWEVERRYRDFYTLYRRLKSLFTDQGWTLPFPWFSVEKESRKIFGNASPDVVSERSVLIQECLRAIIHSGYFSSPPSALLWFLCPQGSVPSSPASQIPVPWSNRQPEAGNISNLGKTISLIVEIRPYKSMKQLLEAQHYTCVGCHKHFDDGMTLVQDFVQALGWGKPRLCEYTGQLFCSSCHTNETAVLPAKVLHYWDFTPYPVSQLAKSYLDSIYEQPMLCVSAVNPFLFSKIPALHHIMNVRKKIGTMLPYVRCPFRRTINKGLGSRRYLLESNDFFALKDLIDLSKGAFAALPVMVEMVSSKILEHIADQCLICCDVGVPCSARQACDDPSSLIFPFQEGEIERCKSCGSVFHKPCFRKLTSCSCGALIGEDKMVGASNRLSRKASDFLGRSSSSGLSMGLISGLFSRVKPEKEKDHRDDTVILMGSLPSTSI
ncbi:uncharacterized protein LOC8288989 [Ricinus communis]|uniref:uncharacterized protein LOC8288989 n=1 Tax=Ricinus communis TaxID=3988 RepID=UPI00077221B0|nr:uncharacterized protein LOC8288989 [Ricinus communis]|eukprot:XP_015579695.1 uncharacterized protein LOC8288989 [Ricinus communis]